AVMTAFVTSMKATNIYQYWKVDSIFQHAITISPANQVILDTLYNRMLSKHAAIVSDTVINALTDTSILAFNTYYHFLDSMNIAIRNGLITARSYNNSITPALSYEISLKHYNNVTLFRLIYPDSTSHVIDSITTLVASTCLDNGGFAVKKARWLDTDCGNSIIGYSDLCPREGIVEEKKETTVNHDFNITPNPTQGYFRINSNVDFNTSNITMTNILGENIPLYLTHMPVTKEVTINCFSVPNGLYLLSIRGSNNKLTTLKVIIQH
ncbi:MAG TPA: T9SS type A sorting domain-containing protein, partial [Saprospiraceae bacterium]|nr:T9SS type A sorting domain-containing protein [Saprospiraceae bacterium]